MFKQEVIDQLTEYTLATWELDSSHSTEVTERLRDIIMKCCDEYLNRPDRILKGAYENIKKAQRLLDKADGLLSSSYTVSFKDAPFSDLLPDDYAKLENVPTFSQDKTLKSLQETTFLSSLVLKQWLEKNEPVSPTRTYHSRKIIINQLHALYHELTGERHIDRNNPDLDYAGERIHTPFSKVALLMDGLMGNPHKELMGNPDEGIAPIPKRNGNDLNINEIVNCSPEATSSFCKEIKKNID